MPPKRHGRPKRYSKSMSYRRPAYRKRSGRRLQAANSNRRPILMSRNPRTAIPERAIVKFRQNTEMFLVAGSSVGNVQWIANVLYRPWSAATFNTVALCAGYASTDSPNGYVSYCSAVGLYQRYRVLSVGVKVSCTGPVNGGDTMKFCVVPAPNSNTFAGYRTASQGANAVVCMPQESTIYSPAMCKGSWTIAQISGTTPRAVMDDEVYAATAPTSTPLRPIYLNLFMESSNQHSIGSSVYFTVDLYWTVQFEGGGGANPSD